jgi:hypothetical protein
VPFTFVPTQTELLQLGEHWHIGFSYLNVGGTFYYLCSILDGGSRSTVRWEIRDFGLTILPASQQKSIQSVGHGPGIGQRCPMTGSGQDFKLAVGNERRELSALDDRKAFVELAPQGGEVEGGVGSKLLKIGRVGRNKIFVGINYSNVNYLDPTPLRTFSTRRNASRRLCRPRMEAR